MASKSHKTSKRPRKTVDQQLELARKQKELLRLKMENDSLKELSAATSRAAKRDRLSRDWLSTQNASADYVILRDFALVTSRARQMLQDSPIANSMVRAKVRNMVGRGVEPVFVPPVDISKAGEAVYKKVAKAFTDWADDPRECDAEGVRTFWRVQQIASSEQFITGNSLWVRVAGNDAIGSAPFRLRQIDVEQLNADIMAYHDPVTGQQFEVRNGIEVDKQGRRRAIHVYTRAPQDVGTFTTNSATERIDFASVYHVFLPGRSNQTLGESEMKSFLRDLWDLDQARQANLVRQRMEACVGLISQRNSVPTDPNEDTLDPASGLPQQEFRPGMVFRGMTGETLIPFDPKTPGNLFEPFHRLNVTSMSAAAGSSRGETMREASGSYSAARQDMLETDREVKAYQDMLVDTLLARIVEDFVDALAARGDLSAEELELAQGITAIKNVEYTFPVRPWIDPEKEARGMIMEYEIGLASLSELTARKGTRYARVLEQRAADRRTREAYGEPEPVTKNMPLPEPEVAEAEIADAKNAQ